METEVSIVEEKLGFPFWTPARRWFRPDSPFFKSGDVERELLAKQLALDLTDDEKRQLLFSENEDERGVFCPIVGCGSWLKSLENFEDHYNARHAASCSVCSRVYPTSRLLSIHVSEAHGSFFQAKVARGFSMYECLVEGCGLKLKSYKGRQQHLVDKHKFPPSFEFFKKAHPSQKQRRKVVRQRRQVGGKSVMEVEMDGLVAAVSKLNTGEPPSSLSFGRRHARGLMLIPQTLQHQERPDPVPPASK